MSITINGTTGISGVDGSAGTPALQGSDPNTGIYSPGANQVAVATNGTARLYIASDGKVGIGTTAPQEELHIASTEPTLRLEDTDHVAYAQINAAAGNLRFDTDNGNQEANSNTSFRIDGSEKMRIDSSGRLGIGTSSPGDYWYQGNQFVVANTGGNAGATFAASTTGVSSLFFADGTTGTEARRGVVAYYHSDDSMRFNTNGDNERLRIANTGAFGLSGANYGSSGQVLTSQGSGSAPQWATPAGGKILQVLQDTKTDTDSTTNSIANSVTISGLSQAITMSAATNRVLVMAQVSISGESNSEAALSLYRGTTQIYLGNSGTGVRASVPVGMGWSSAGWQGNSASIVFVDTPGTGTHSYTVRFGGNGSSRIWVNRTGRNGTSDPLNASSITLMEVAA